MTDSGLKYPICLDNLKKAIVSIMKAAADEEITLANMLHIEDEMLEKAKRLSANLEEYVAVNESVNGVLKNINKVQMMTQIKLQYLDELLEQTGESENEDGSLEE